MTTNYHTAIATGAAANAATINTPLAALDAQLTATQGEMTTARGGYANLAARLSAQALAGGNVATLANGAASAGQKVVDVDSTTGFIAGAYVAYMLVGGAVEYNTIDAVTSSTRLTLTTNIGTGGIANDTYVAMVSPSEVAAANAINHDDDLTLSNTIDYVSRDAYYPEAYGAVGNGVADDTAALQAMIVDVKARVGGGKTKWALIQLRPGAIYKITDSLNLCDTEDIVIDGGTPMTQLTFVKTDGVLFDCLGSTRLVFRNFTIYGDATSQPKVGFSLGRSTSASGEDTGNTTFDHIHMRGYWKIAPFYNVSHEICHLNNVWLLVEGPTTAKYGIFLSGYDEESIPSAVTRSATVSMSTFYCRNFNVGGAATLTGWVPFYIGATAANVVIRDGFTFVYNDNPAFLCDGATYGLILDGISVEGNPDKTLHLRAYAGTSSSYSGNDNFYDISVRNVGFGTYPETTGTGIYQDANTVIYGLQVSNCGGEDGTDSRMTLAGEVWYANVAKWGNKFTGAFVANKFYYSRVEVIEHTVTITEPLGCQVVAGATGTASYHHFQTGVRVGSFGGTALAEINNILTASASWNPGELDDGESASSYVALAGVTAADPWFCMAHFSSITAGGWVLTATAADSVVYFVLTNRTGGTVDLASGTISVVAWKITAA